MEEQSFQANFEVSTFVTPSSSVCLVTGILLDDLYETEVKPKTELKTRIPKNWKVEKIY